MRQGLLLGSPRPICLVNDAATHSMLGAHLDSDVCCTQHSSPQPKAPAPLAALRLVIWLVISLGELHRQPAGLCSAPLFPHVNRTEATAALTWEHARHLALPAQRPAASCSMIHRWRQTAPSASWRASPDPACNTTTVTRRQVLQATSLRGLLEKQRPASLMSVA